MQTITGRITKDAAISTLSDERKVVNFTIAVNDRFRPKNRDEFKEVTNYYQCSYWLGTRIAAHLKKGILVEICGRIGVNVWNNMQGEAKASLTLHAQFIKLHGKAKSADQDGGRVVQMNDERPTDVPNDDLPF